jgi:hypothetical protein
MSRPKKETRRKTRREVFVELAACTNIKAVCAKLHSLAEEMGVPYSVLASRFIEDLRRLPAAPR